MNLSKDVTVLANAYTNDVFLVEMHKKYIDMINEIRNDLPFDNIFGKNLRILIPFSENANYTELKDELAKLSGFVSFNPEKKEVVRNVTFKRADTGESGTKPQVLNIGKAISSLKIPDEKKKQLLNWFSDYSSNIAELEKLSQYSILLSRHPIDILRMSDASTLHSCHAQGGMYFHCAIQEAKTGGPIAYLVNTNDIKKIDEKTFQTGEIFADSERKIEGITPIARVRIRRYSDQKNDENEYAIPEIRVYGKKISGFLDSVTKFLKTKQSFSKSVEEIIRDFQTKKIIKRGGSYSDSSDSALFNNYLGTNVLFGSLHHSAEDTEEEGESAANRADQFRDELEDAKLSYQARFQNSNVWYDVNEADDNEADDTVYYTAGGSTSVAVSDIDFTGIDFLNIDAEDFDFYYELSGDLARKHSIIDTNYRTKNLSSQEKRNHLRFSKFLNLFCQFSKIDNYKIGTIELHQVQWDANEKIDKPISPVLVILWKFTGENSDSDISENTDDFRYFCREILDDEDAELIKKAFIKALYQSGMMPLKDEKPTSAESIVQKFENGDLVFDNFEYDDISIEATAGFLFPFTDEQITYLLSHSTNVLPYIEKYIENLYEDFIQTSKKQNIQQTSFKYYTESIQVDQNIDIKIAFDRTSSYTAPYKLPLYLKLSLEPTIFTETFLNFMVYFDKMFKNFVSSVCLGYILKTLPSNLPMASPEAEKQKDWLLKQIAK